jgi:hypothetical protein
MLEPRQMRRDLRQQRGRVRRRARRCDQDDNRRLSEIGIRHTNDSGFQHPWQRVQQHHKLLGVNAEPARNNRILLPAHNP